MTCASCILRGAGANGASICMVGLFRGAIEQAARGNVANVLCPNTAIRTAAAIEKIAQDPELMSLLKKIS